jgi:hypothetical protein
MLIEAIRDHLRAAPFEPFVVQMTDGRRFEIPHPEFAALNRKGTEFYVINQNDIGVRLSTLLVASLEPLQKSQS